MKISPLLTLALLAPFAASAQAASTIRVYVAGESIEARNRYVAPPFTTSGALNERGGGELRNDNEEYGWMVPMRDRLRLRAPDLDIQFVGADVWGGDNDSTYSGTYPTTAPEPTSAISGTSIPSWLEQRREELEGRTFCYDLAFASRGGNDFGNDDDAEYVRQLKDLVLLLSHGSSCRADPIVVVTGHMPDDQRDGEPEDTYVALVKHRFVERALRAVNELATEHPGVRVRFVDQYTPFLLNTPTTAFPTETWSTGGIPDYEKIVRDYTERTGHPMSHVRDLFDCVKSRRATVANPEVMYRSMTTVHAANICMWLKRDMKYDPAKAEFIGDAEANRLRSRAMREPWII